MAAPVVRQATPGDTQQLHAFVTAAYGPLADLKVPARWQWQFRRNPGLDARDAGLPIWIAIDAGEIVGQYCSIPVVLRIGDEQHRAAWGADFMIRADHRGKGLAHQLSDAMSAHHRVLMAIIMVDSVRRVFERSNAVALPPVHVLRKAVRFDRACVRSYLQAKTRRRPGLARVAAIGCKLFADGLLAAAGNAALGLRNAVRRPPRPTGTTAFREVARFDAEVDGLWQRVRGDYGVIVERSQNYLNWRFVDEPQLHYHRFLAVRGGEAKGYVVVRKPEPAELDVGMITELFAARADEETIAALLQHALGFFGRDVAVVELPTTVAEIRRVAARFGFLAMATQIPVCICADPVVRAALEARKAGVFLSRGDQDWDQLVPAR